MTNTSAPTIANALTTLSTEELARLAAQIADTIAARETAADVITTEETPATSKARKSARRDHSAPWFETKMIDGHVYRYQRWWENGKKRSKYIGKA